MASLRSILQLVLLAAARISAEVSILSKVQYLYDRSPKLRIRVSNIADVNPADITLAIGVKNQNPLVSPNDITLDKDDDGEGLVIKLNGNKRWADLSGRVPPVAVFVSSIKFADGKEQLDETTLVANVIGTPNVYPDDELILYKTKSNELRINCSGLVGVKDVDLYFDPPLYKEVAYEIVSKFPKVDNDLALRLRHGYEWRDTPGPLYVKGIDTGAGAVKVGGDTGVLVATVKDNLPYHDVTVESTFLDQVVYHDEPTIYVSGTGFNPEGNTIRFANGILGKGVNYTITKVTETKLTLSLAPGSFWRGNVENLPGYLTVIAINAGDGFVAVGPINTAKGKDIATVYERPKVFPSTTKLYQTHSHELHIAGAGFTDAIAAPMIKFQPELVLNEDYTIWIQDRDDIEITLKDGKKWGAVGNLVVQAINTRGDPDGWVVFPGNGITVAEIVPDEDAVNSGGVVIYPMGTRVYQSALQRTIDLSGVGFKSDMELTFDPPLKAGVDYDLKVSNSNMATLTLRQGKQWRTEDGLLMAMSVKVDKKSYPLAGGAGIRVAVVFEDPVILPGSDNFHESQSKVISVRGQGFTNEDEISITLKPTDTTSFKILAVMDDLIRLQLKPDLDWLPSYLHLKPEEEKKIPLEVTSIDTGAGIVKLSTPVTIGYVVADRPGVVCDDSCEFSFDGVCDDGSEQESSKENYHTMYGDDFQSYAAYGSDMRDGNGDGKNDDNFGFDDYYMVDDGYKVSACVRGTDCTDCGGVDAIVDYSKPPPAGSGVEVCSNTCAYARDGVCDDPRGENYCALGTDCQDCGPVGADNFTRIDDDGWWDDDDDYWNYNDGSFLDQAKGLDSNRHVVRNTRSSSNPATPAGVFMTVLEGMVYTLGALFAAAGLYIGLKWYNGQPLPFADAFNPDARSDVEGEPLMRMPITPDVIRT